jgi:hypothetical protein
MEKLLFIALFFVADRGQPDWDPKPYGYDAEHRVGHQVMERMGRAESTGIGL